MKKNRVLAVIMAVLMMVTLLPSMVFAAAVPQGALDGKLKVKGTIAVGVTLSADYSKVKPEGITDDYVSFSWSLKDGDVLTEVGTDKTYKVEEKDLGFPIVLKITGKEEMGISGELTVTTQEVSATEEDAKALAQQKKTETSTSESGSDETLEQDSQDSTITITGLGETDTDSGNTEETEDSTEDQAEDSSDTTAGSDEKTVETGETKAQNGDSASTEELTYSAVVSTEDGSGVLNFGTVTEGYTEIPEVQYVTITNTGTADLNFKEISPENFMAEDINGQPLKSGEQITVWVKPREGLNAGEYKDLITYQTEEGVDVFFEADLTVEAQTDDGNNGNADAGKASEPSDSEEGQYELTADPAEIPFDDLTEGYTEVDQTRTVTIRNTGTETVTLKQPQSDNFDIEPVSEGENNGEIMLAQGDEQMFTVQPKLGLEAKDDPYEEDLVFATSDNKASAAVKASVLVNGDSFTENSVDITPKDLNFGELEQGYSNAPEAQTVTVTNTGTEAIRLVQPTAKNFEVGALSAEVLNPGEDNQATFTIQPKTGLSAGEYSGKIRIADKDGNIDENVSVSFTVTKPEPVYDLSVKPEEGLNFGTVNEGYKDLPEAQTVTVTNTGNTKITLQQPTGKNYTVGALSQTELEAGKSATFTVQPKKGLSKEEYLEDIVISNSADVSAYITAYFSVRKNTDNSEKENDLTGIRKPSSITDLPNGTEKTQKALKLPETVTITTTKGEQKASVKWDVKGCSYDPSSVDRQTFNVKGTVTLPDGVKNPDKISTVIAVSITVNAYKGSEVKESDNKITGIDPNGKYDTNTKITFTAVGAGMDNSNPVKGDTRFQPRSWQITEKRDWDSEPYTATFRVSKPGEYTLKVNFVQQRYDGSRWTDTDVQSESKVTFTVSQAEILTATPSPAVTQSNKKSAVQTGDSTPIMTFVIILIAAVVCIGGILIYRRKKK